jgi:hypothetical protein
MKWTRYQNNKRLTYTLPEVVSFEGVGVAPYDILGWHRPKRGEFYLSGAVVKAYVAPNDLSDEFIVVQPRQN